MREDDAFLDRLERLVLSRGFAGLTVAEIARELRCSRRRVYAAASSKDALILTVIERFFAGVRAEGDARAATAAPIERRIRAYFQPGVEGALRLSPAFQRDIAADAEGRAIYDRHQRLRTEGLERLIEEGIAAGELRDVNARVAAEMMLATVQRIRTPEFQATTGLSYARALADAYALLRHGLEAPLRERVRRVG